MIIQMVRLRNFPINNIMIIIVCLIIILADFKEGIKKYRNKILIIVVTLHLSLSFICTLVFNANEYLNLFTSYLKISVFHSTDSSLVDKPDGVISFTDQLGNAYNTACRNNVASYQYMIDKRDTIERKMELISSFLFKIESYNYVDNDSYSVKYKVKDISGVLTININDYSKFSIIKFK